MYYISVSEGILEKKHCEKIGSAIWQFLWCINKITKVDENGMGWVLGGKPVKLEDLQIGCRKTNSRNLQRLKKNGYLDLKHAPYGIIIKVIKAKKRFHISVQPTCPKVSNLLDKSVQPNKTVVVDNDNKTVKQIADLQTSFLFFFYRERIRKTAELTSLAKEKCVKVLKALSFRTLLLAIYNKSRDEWWMSNIAPKWSFAHFLSRINKLEEYAQQDNQLPDSLFQKPELSDLLKKIRELKK